MCEWPVASISASGKSSRSKLSSKFPLLPPLAEENEEKTSQKLSITRKEWNQMSHQWMWSGFESTYRKNFADSQIVFEGGKCFQLILKKKKKKKREDDRMWKNVEYGQFTEITTVCKQCN